jgi:hypothetical protein
VFAAAQTSPCSLQSLLVFGSVVFSAVYISVCITPASNAALPHCRAVLELPPEIVDVAALMAEGGPTTEEPFTEDSGDDTSPSMDSPDPLDYPAVVQALMVCMSPPPAIEQ